MKLKVFISLCINDFGNFLISRGEDDISLTDIMVFFSAAAKPPPLGFPDKPMLEFNSSNVYPTASTCALVLKLPTKYQRSYTEFKRAMFVGLKFHGDLATFN